MKARAINGFVLGGAIVGAALATAASAQVLVPRNQGTVLAPGARSSTAAAAPAAATSPAPARPLERARRALLLEVPEPGAADALSAVVDALSTRHSAQSPDRSTQLRSSKMR